MIFNIEKSQQSQHFASLTFEDSNASTETCHVCVESSAKSKKLLNRALKEVIKWVVLSEFLDEKSRC